MRRVSPLPQTYEELIGTISQLYNSDLRAVYLISDETRQNQIKNTSDLHQVYKSHASQKVVKFEVTQEADDVVALNEESDEDLIVLGDEDLKSDNGNNDPDVEVCGSQMYEGSQCDLCQTCGPEAHKFRCQVCPNFKFCDSCEGKFGHPHPYGVKDQEDIEAVS